jgi:hypothetical protein
LIYVKCEGLLKGSLIRLCFRRERSLIIFMERRCCGDNSIVSYANATFYPKMVADVTVGTTTTAQTLYNPLPQCGCGCK